MTKNVTLLGLSNKFKEDDKWLVVASSSQSRIFIFKEIIKFTNCVFIPSQFDENLDKSLYTPVEYIKQTALHKAQAVAKILWSGTNSLNISSMFNEIITPFHNNMPFSDKSSFPFVVGFDTIMFKDNRIFEKPVDRDDAKDQLKSLSGSTHHIFTGVAILSKSNGYQSPIKLFHDSTEMSLEPMCDEEIELVLDTGDYKNVCGSYRIGGAGGQFSTLISGSYTNIIGVPVKSFVAELNQLTCGV
ncbi:septum formation protein [Babesia microti strain RI]|uniref:Septum formation protein n=1 Tax=Babesia microti (strain RI) TaxID=1133968 RepID=I7I9P3_BABMR|nr:septum formation protein [Babesia microti strain RI]CCF75389.1 septum formation protein [Babesia microti strain RI]|eukprot:XP_012649797.1 septum formation protein [Babesia microti strain RI]